MRRFIICLSFLSVFGSCNSFKEVKNFATNSEKNLNNFKNVDYTFSTNCNYKCLQRALVSSEFLTIGDHCLCKEAGLADKNLNQLIRVLKEYFNGLVQLSESKLTEFSIDPIQQPLVEGKYIKKADIKPYSAITGILTTLITDGYRAKKLNQIIEMANSDIILLLEKARSIVEENLLSTLSTRQTDIQQIYHDLYMANGSTTLEKYTIQKMYFSEMMAISKKAAALKGFCAALVKISKGHQSLYNNKNRYKEKDVKKIINKYAHELNEISQQILN